MAETFTSKINGNYIYAKRAEATRSGLLFETFDGKYGILPDGLANDSTSGDRNPAHVLATLKDVLDAQTSALSFKGIVDGTHPLPASGYVKGWTYEVAAAGTYAGEQCEAGDMIVCVNDFGTTAKNSDWAVIQKNIDGAVTGPVSSVDEQLPVFNGTNGKVIKDSGVSISKSETTGADNAHVPTVGVVNDTIAALDADVTSSDGTNVQVEVTEVDGKITAVSVTDSTASATHVHGNITNDGKIGSTADLAVVTGSAGAVTTADMTTADPAVPSEGTTTATAFIDSVSQDSKGKITATKKNLPEASTSTKGIVQLASSIGATVGTENNKAATEKAVRDAINDLDVSDISGFGAGKTVATLTETDGKIAATFQDIAITGAQVTVASATNGNFAGLDASGHVVDSGKKAADFKPVQTAVADPTASGDASAFIATISQDANGVITATKANLPIAKPTSGSVTHPGLVTYETIDL